MLLIMSTSKRVALAVLSINLTFISLQAQNPDREQVESAMKRAGSFFRSKAAMNGGYVYYWSPDLSVRLGEGVAKPYQIFIQPPSTPSVGMAFLHAYDATGDPLYLNAAHDAGKAIIYGQLKSGGWRQTVDFDPRSKTIGYYRNGKGSKKGSNNSTLDDDQSQSAMRFLIRLDKALGFKKREVHESISIALNALLAAQFPNGAFPQVWTGPTPRNKVIKASFPTYDYRTEGRFKNYWDMYTLNDGLAGAVTQVLIEAHETYKDVRYLNALKQLGNFLILAQMPEPQPAWAQQYGYNMHPIWARKFEPPAITGGETQDVLDVLMTIYEITKDERYLKPVPSAMNWLKRSHLKDGRLARYYEMRSNKPLYMERSGKVYSLTYSDSNLPSHYGWKITSHLSELSQRYSQIKAGIAPQKKPVTSTEVKRIISGLDRYGRWISTFRGEALSGQPKFKPGDHYINADVFNQNMETLSSYLNEMK